MFKFLFFISLLLSLTSCHKSNGNNSVNSGNDKDTGNFVALIDQTKRYPTMDTATYYPKYNQLYISSRDFKTNGSRLQGGIDLDLAAPLKSYPLEPNGNNAFALFSPESFYSDINVADAGGTMVLTKFDTVNKKISGNLQFTGYNSNRNSRMKFETIRMNDVPLKIDTFSYTGNNITCTVQGAATSQWATKNVSARIECVAGKEETLYIRISSMVKNYVNGKTLIVVVPLKNGKGNYQVYPELPPYVYCGNNYIMSSFCSYNYDRMYYASSGQLTILAIDTAQRKLNATFNIQYRDTTSKGETVQISNGTINLNTWSSFGER